MITGLAVRNFKNLVAIPAAEDQLVPFGPLNVLIGPNGCGKSSLLQAIDFLRAFFQSSVEVYLRERGWEYDDLPNLRQDARKISWHLQADLDADLQGRGAGRYVYTVTLQPRRYLGIGEERLVWTPREVGQEPQVLLDRDGRQCVFLDRRTGQRETASVYRQPASFFANMDPAQERDRFPEAMHFREWVERFRLFLIWDPKLLRQPSFGPSPNQEPRQQCLGPSGENLAAVLATLCTEHPATFQKLIERIQHLVPTFSGLEVGGSGTLYQSISQLEGSNATFNSRQMSDGILRLLAVASLLYIDQPPSVVMFEEPENGVHPQLIRDVVQILRELTQRKPPRRTQVFITTHNPYVVDEFIDHPEQVYGMERNRPQAGASITRLSDRSQAKKVREVFNSSLGEAWVSGLLGATAGG